MATLPSLSAAPGDVAELPADAMAGFDICFVHPKSNAEFPVGGEGVLIELVQAPPEVIAAFAGLAS